MIHLYGLLLKTFRILLPVLRFFPHGKIRYYFKNQGQVQGFVAHRPIWIHASSGEIEYAQSVIRELKNRYPQIPLLVTHTSLSSRIALSKLKVEAFGVSPLDESREIQKFLKKWSPRTCLIARTDLWPQTIRELHRADIPIYLFSATFSKGMKKTNWLSRQLLRTALPRLQKIFFVSKADQDFCRKIYPKTQGEVLGDTRYDQVFFRLAHAEAPDLTAYDRLIVAGSTWPEDERVLIRAAAALKAEGWKWIWVPHEVDESHLRELENGLRQKQISFRRFSRIQNFGWNETDVLIVDRVGLLASLYPMGRLAFVGGSFKKQVHSVMEALAAGLPTLVGPHHHNSREALEFKAQGFVMECGNSQEFIAAVRHFDLSHDQIRAHIQRELRAKVGGTERLIQALEAEGILTPGR